MPEPRSTAGRQGNGSDEPNADEPIVPAPIVPAHQASARARWAEAVFIGAFCVYAGLAVLASRYAYFDWDLTLARSIQSISLPGFAKAMIVVSLLGSGWPAWLLVILAGLAMIQAGLRNEGVICMAGTALGSAANLLFKTLIGRPRPTDILVNVAMIYKHESFPSGHVVFFVEFFGFVFFLTYVLIKPGRLRGVSLVVLGLLIFLVGISRVYLGAHWPSDVVGAYLAGGIWLTLMIAVYRRVKARQLRPASP